MKLLRAAHFALILYFFWLASGRRICAVNSSNPGAVTSAAAVAELPVIAKPARAFPALNLGRGLNLTWVAMFTPDALFHTSIKSYRPWRPSLEEIILMSAARANTRLGATATAFLTYAYGHPSVLYALRHVVTDSPSCD